MNSNCPSHGGFPGREAQFEPRSVLPTASTVWKAVPAAVRLALVAAASVLVAWGGIPTQRNAAVLAGELVFSHRDASGDGSQGDGSQGDGSQGDGSQGDGSQGDQDGRYQAPASSAVKRMVVVVQPEPRPAGEPGSAVPPPSSSITLRALSGSSAAGPWMAIPRPANAEPPTAADPPAQWAAGPSATHLSAYQPEPSRTHSPRLPSPTAEEIRTPRAEKKVAAEFDLDSRPIGAVTTNIRCQKGDLPQDVAQAKLKTLRGRSYDQLTDREWEALCYMWEAPALRHHPLYFEEVNLERYGYSWPHLKPLQPALSCGQFFVTLPMLPYKMWCEPPRECDYTLGQYRPGSPVPYEVQLPCWRPGAGAFEAGTVAGLILLLP